MVKVKFMNMMPCQDYQNFLENLDFRDIRSWDLIKFYWSKTRLSKDVSSVSPALWKRSPDRSVTIRRQSVD